LWFGGERKKLIKNFASRHERREKEGKAKANMKGKCCDSERDEFTFIDFAFDGCCDGRGRCYAPASLLMVSRVKGKEPVRRKISDPREEIGERNFSAVSA
jgi:hypothetical protein